MTMAQTVLHPDLLEFCVRDELNRTATRLAHQHVVDNTGAILKVEVVYMYLVFIMGEA